MVSQIYFPKNKIFERYFFKNFLMHKLFYFFFGTAFIFLSIANSATQVSVYSLVLSVIRPLPYTGRVMFPKDKPEMIVPAFADIICTVRFRSSGVILVPDCGGVL